MSKKLHELLASMYSLYIKVQNFHWNVSGSDFFELHELFEGQYQNIAQDIDEIAEFIRISGEKVPSGLNEFAKNTLIKDSSCNVPGPEMVAELIEDYSTILRLMTNIHKELSDIGIQHQISSMHAKYKKTLWMFSTWKND